MLIVTMLRTQNLRQMIDSICNLDLSVCGLGGARPKTDVQRPDVPHDVPPEVSDDVSQDYQTISNITPSAGDGPPDDDNQLRYRPGVQSDVHLNLERKIPVLGRKTATLTEKGHSYYVDFWTTEFKNSVKSLRCKITSTNNKIAAGNVTIHELFKIRSDLEETFNSVTLNFHKLGEYSADNIAEFKDT